MRRRDAPALPLYIALSNLKEIVESIAEDNPAAALKAGKTILAKIEILQVWHGAQDAPDF